MAQTHRQPNQHGDCMTESADSVKKYSPIFLWVKQIFVTVLKVVTKAQKNKQTKIRFDKNILNKNYKVIEIEIQCLPYCFNIAF